MSSIHELERYSIHRNNQNLSALARSQSNLGGEHNSSSPRIRRVDSHDRNVGENAMVIFPVPSPIDMGAYIIKAIFYQVPRLKGNNESSFKILDKALDTDLFTEVNI